MDGELYQTMVDFQNAIARRALLRECVRHTAANVRMYRRKGMPEIVLAASLSCIKGLRAMHSSHFRRT